MQDQETADLAPGQQRVAAEVGVDLLHALFDKLIHLRLLRQVGIAGIRQIAPLSPVAYGIKVDIDQHTDFLTTVAVRHHLFDMLEEFELVLHILGREHGPVKCATAHPAYVFDAVDNFQVPLRVDKAGVIGVVPTVGA